MTTRYNPIQEGESIDFLKDQVQRLSGVLSQYQKKYLPLSPEDEAESSYPSEAPHAPWLTNKQFLSPLLTEYDHTINDLNKQITTYQSELASLSSRVQKISDENTKLHSDLRKSLESQLKSTGGSGVTSEGSAVVEAVQQQMDVLSKERDSYIDLWRQTSKELETVQKSEREKAGSLHKCKTELVATQQAAILAQQTLDELQVTCQKLDQERDQCLKTAHEREKELTNIQDDMSQTRAELKAANIKNVDLKRSLDEITLQLKRRESERKRIDDHEQSLDDRIHHLQMHITDVEAKLLVSQREAALLKGEKSDLEEALSTAQSKMSALEQREYEAVVHVKESMQIAEDALMEKEQALIREQQLNQEIIRLKKALTTILQEAGERTRNEIDAVREECNAGIDKMAEEIQKLEQECGEKQAQFDRAVRDKKAVEKELEKVTQHTPQEAIQRGEVLHELQSRVCAAERARDEISMKLDSAMTSVKSLELKLSEEKQASHQMNQEHRSSQRKTQEELQQYQQQKIKLVGEIKELHQRLRQSDQLREASEMKMIKETSELNQRQAMTERELVCRLESSEEAHQRSVNELRELMTAQHRVGVRWREESKSLAQRFEQTVSNLKADITKYKQHSEELTVRLHQMKLERNDLADQLRKATNSTTILQRQLGETEAHVEATNSQLTVLLVREKQLLQERRELQRQLDKIKVKMSRVRGLDGPPNMTLGASSRLGQPDPPRSHSVTRHTPSHPYHVPTTLPPHHTHLDSSQWNMALSELRHSIRQVRQDLGLKSETGQTSFSNGDGVSYGHSVSYSKGHEDEESELSEQSVLSRGDLTPRQNSSRISLVQS